MSEREEGQDERLPDPDEEDVEIDPDIPRPDETELSPGQLEPGAPESRPVDPRIGPLMVG
jgi:hypothetical protein